MLMLYRFQHRSIYDARRHRDPGSAADPFRKLLLSHEASKVGGGGENLQAFPTANAGCPASPASRSTHVRVMKCVPGSHARKNSTWISLPRSPICTHLSIDCADLPEQLARR